MSGVGQSMMNPLLLPVRIWYLSESSPFYHPAILGNQGWRGEIGNGGPSIRSMSGACQRS